MDPISALNMWKIGQKGQTADVPKDKMKLDFQESVGFDMKSELTTQKKACRF
jgi:hypothetical protein